MNTKRIITSTIKITDEQTGDVSTFCVDTNHDSVEQIAKWMAIVLENNNKGVKYENIKSSKTKR